MAGQVNAATAAIEHHETHAATTGSELSGLKGRHEEQAATLSEVVICTACFAHFDCIFAHFDSIFAQFYRICAHFDCSFAQFYCIFAHFDCIFAHFYCI